jgi:hypothetical protein
VDTGAFSDLRFLSSWGRTLCDVFFQALLTASPALTVVAQRARTFGKIVDRSRFNRLLEIVKLVNLFSGNMSDVLPIYKVVFDIHIGDYFQA